MAEEQIQQNPTETKASEVKPLVLSCPIPEKTEEEKKQEVVKQEQERTRIKKQLFLEYLPKSFGVVGDVCEKVGINRATYYEWKKIDPDFAEAIAKIDAEKNDWVEDQLFKLMRKGDGPSVRFHMERRNPLYKQKTVNEIYAGEKTLEDLLDSYQNEDETTANKQGADREAPKNPEQTGATSTVQAQLGAAVLLVKENAPKPDPESQAKGNNQGN